MHQQQTGLLFGQPVEEFVDQDLHHSRAKVRLDAMLTNRQYQQFLTAHQGIGLDPIDRQTLCAGYAVRNQAGIRPELLHTV